MPTASGSGWPLPRLTGTIALTFARLSRLSADLLGVRQGGDRIAGAAERHATALHLFDQAESSREPDVLAAADAAVREAEKLLMAARR